MEDKTNNNWTESNEILVQCRILSYDNEGNYSVLSKQSCKEIIEQERGRRVAIDNCFVVTFDSEYSVFNLFNDLREKFNIPKSLQRVLILITILSLHLGLLQCSPVSVSLISIGAPQVGQNSGRISANLSGRFRYP